MPTRRSKAAAAAAEAKRPAASKKRTRAGEPNESDSDADSTSPKSPAPSENREPKRAKVSQQKVEENNNDSNWDAQTLSTMNDRLRDELAQVRTELEHSQRLLQLNMGRAPILDDRACQSETTTLIDQYDSIRKSTQIQLSKMKPSHPKYWWWEYAHHLNTEMCRLVRESWTYRGFSA